MSVLIYAEVSKNKVKKSSLEATNYAANIAKNTNTTVTAVVVGNSDNAILVELGKAGANKVLRLTDAKLANHDSQAMTAALEQVAKAEGASFIIFSHDFTAKAVAPRLAARMRAGYVPAAVGNPEMNGNTTVVRKNVFSGKATADYVIHTDNKIISLLPNTFPVILGDGNADVVDFSVDLSAVTPRVTVKEVKKSEGELLLPDAELVVSAGRGMKGPENWGIIEDLAKEFGAATACSRPVSDIGWRPHHEHVGQTGIAIRPNLYIAVGISGAIQHLAGVNGSKTIVVINKDPEAPFFKAADYGIVGDAFEIVPKITAALKAFKAAH